jgi:hypothetical protein
MTASYKKLWSFCRKLQAQELPANSCLKLKATDFADHRHPSPLMLSM